ncbi:4'-phosphopantetheinyl transferase [Burkholderia ambifaria]|uniref:4'-phosphopantetheinyl transferase family protein n=1 Tax=Burkholderia pyrrocinia TaxID=60550 RepID=UPI001589ADB5|nr:MULTISPECIES: 4'-phosphopantetheinyl transferase superfamily protein [Burkholderia cepacia complex]MDR6502210.1 4'-phosphopantetheinyl transferase [Burkholderia ambifaria]
MTLNRHEVAWWSASIDVLGVSGLEALAASCDDDEMARAGRFVFERDRLAYLAAHGLLRRALSHAEPSCGPREWRFSTGRYGRPELDKRFRRRPHFNLSHCETRVTCVVSGTIPCGVDVETLRRSPGHAVMDACLAPSERARIARFDAPGRDAEFLRLWTLKEAVAKGAGMGLHLPFCELAFELEAAPRLLAAPAEAAGPWRLAQHVTADRHVESLALRIGGDAEIKLTRIEWPDARMTQAGREMPDRGAEWMGSPQPA